MDHAPGRVGRGSQPPCPNRLNNTRRAGPARPGGRQRLPQLGGAGRTRRGMLRRSVAIAAAEVIRPARTSSPAACPRASTAARIHPVPRSGAMSPSRRPAVQISAAHHPDDDSSVRATDHARLPSQGLGILIHASLAAPHKRFRSRSIRRLRRPHRRRRSARVRSRSVRACHRG